MYFHGLIAHFFWVWKKKVQQFIYCWMYHSLLAHLLNGILVVFKFITALLIIPQTFTCMLLCGHKFQTALGKYQGQQLLDCMVRVWQFLTKLNTTKSSRVLFCYFVSPSIVTEKSYCSTSLSAFGAVSVFTILIVVWWCSLSLSAAIP